MPLDTTQAVSYYLLMVNNIAIGSLVAFLVPGINGLRRIAGKVVAIKGDRIEVRAQLGGYYTIAIADVLDAR